MAETMRYVPCMRPSIRWPIILVACACIAVAAAGPWGARAVGAPAQKEQKDGQKEQKEGQKDGPKKAPRSGPKSAAQKDAEAFLATITSLVQPVAVTANLADWAALTD